MQMKAENEICDLTFISVRRHLFKITRFRLGALLTTSDKVMKRIFQPSEAMNMSFQMSMQLGQISVMKIVEARSIF